MDEAIGIEKRPKGLGPFSSSASAVNNSALGVFGEIFIPLSEPGLAPSPGLSHVAAGGVGAAKELCQRRPRLSDPRVMGV